MILIRFMPLFPTGVHILDKVIVLHLMYGNLYNKRNYDTDKHLLIILSYNINN